MRPVIAVLLVLLACAKAGAEALPVRSGEHDTFSRLVFEISRSVNWDIGRIEGGYGIKFDRHPLDFDVSGVFDLIPRDRVAAISTVPDKGQVALRTPCACHVDAFELERGWLVVDVKSGRRPAGRFERPLERWSTRAADAPLPLFEQDIVATVFGRNAPLTPNRDDEPGAGTESERLTTVSQPRPRPDRKTAATDLFAFLDVKDAGDAESPAGRRGPALSPRPGRAAEPRQGARANAGVEAIADELRRPAGDADGVCGQAGDFTIEVWRDDRSASQRIAQARSELAAHGFDPSGEALLALVKVYLSLGFVDEARRLRSALSGDGVDARLVKLVMDGLADSREIAASDSYGDLASCGGEAALWALLADTDATVANEASAEKIVDAFSRLPDYMQRMVGSRLSGELARAGYPGKARDLAEMTDTASDHEKSALANFTNELTKDGVALSGGSLAQDPPRLGPRAPAALSELVKSGGEKRPLPETLVEVLDSYGFQLRDTQEGFVYAKASFLASLGASDFEAATRKRRSLLDLAPGDYQRRRINEFYYGSLAEGATAEMFLKNVLGSETELRQLGEKISQKIATRLLALGMAGQAEAVIAGGDGNGSERTRLVRGRAMLAGGAFAEAVRAVAGLDGREAALVRAKASSALGRHADAMGLYARLGEERLLQSEAWLGRDLARVAEIGSDDQKRFAKLLQVVEGQNATAGDQDGIESLSVMSAMVERSRAIRDAARSLISGESGARGAGETSRVQ